MKAPERNDSLRRLYSCPTENGFVQVWENSDLRWLSVDLKADQPSQDCYQSAALLADPASMVIPTMRAMQFALGIRNPQKALLLGLGGGDAVRLIQQHFAECRIDAVDYSGAVIAAYHACFARYQSGPDSVRIVQQESLDYLRQLNHKSYDLIFLDLFQGEELSENVHDLEFHGWVRQSLTPNGLLAINLHVKNRERLVKLLVMIRSAHHNRCLFIPCGADENVVMICFKKPVNEAIDTVLNRWHRRCVDLVGELDFTVTELMALNQGLDLSALFSEGK